MNESAKFPPIILAHINHIKQQMRRC